MNNFTELINNHPWLNIVFIILALIGIIATIITYLKSHKYKQPIYDVSYLNIISNELSRVPDLNINYKNVPIKELSVSQVAFYNLGKEPIRKSDLADLDKVRIEIKNGVIFNYSIKYQSSPVNNFRLELSEDKKSINVQFDFIEKNEGVIIQFFHNAKRKEDILLTGTIIGFGKIKSALEKFSGFKYTILVRNWATKGRFIFLKSLIAFPLLFVFTFGAIIKFLSLYLSRLPKQFFVSKDDDWLQQRL